MQTLYGMNIEIKTFKELDSITLYNILELRNSVFIVEQNCVYQDIDNKDREALHVIFKKKGRVVAYTRCFAPGLYFKEASIGRVVVLKNQRNNNYGHQIMKVSLQAILSNYNTKEVTLSAQTYLKEFYESHGFYKTGKEYLEDGIPHILMRNTAI